MQTAIAVPGQARPAGSPPIDPIFAAIERCKLAIHAFDAAVTVEMELEAQIPDEGRKSEPGRRVVRTDDPRWQASVRNWRKAHDEMDAAKFALLNTKPTTVEGMTMVLSYIGTIERSQQFFPDSRKMHSGATMGDLLIGLSKVCAKLHKSPPATRH